MRTHVHVDYFLNILKKSEVPKNYTDLMKEIYSNYGF